MYDDLLDVQFVDQGGYSLLIRGKPQPFHEQDIDRHSFEMQVRYEVDGLLPMRCEQLDDRFQLLFGFADKRMLSGCCRTVPLSGRQMTRLFAQLKHLLVSLDSYMLLAEHLLLHPDYIFLDEVGEQFHFLHLPIVRRERPTIVAQFRQLCDALLPLAEESVQECLHHLVTCTHQRSFVPLDLFREAEQWLPTEGPGRRDRTMDAQQPVERVRVESQSPDSSRRNDFRKASLWLSLFLLAELAVYLAFSWHAAGLLGIAICSVTYVFRRPVGFTASDSQPTRTRVPDPGADEMSGPNAPAVTDYALNSPNSLQSADRSIHRTVWLTSAEQAIYRGAPSLQHAASGEVVSLVAFPFLIGRDEQSAHLFLRFSDISRSHAEIDELDGDFWLKDLGSRNGTMLNQQRLIPYRPYPLQAGDLVAFQSMEYYFQPDSIALQREVGTHDNQRTTL